MVLKASCLCGSVKFELNADPVMSAICHCTDCQHEGGSFSTDAVFPADSLTYTAGKPTKYEHRGASGKLVTSNFCGKCGSTLVVMQEVMVFSLNPSPIQVCHFCVDLSNSAAVLNMADCRAG